MAARAAATGTLVDEALVARGALLHDIGRARTQGLEHAYVGADMLREPPALPEPVCRIVERHTGAGITADDAKTGGLPERIYVPETLEEKIVAHADNLYSGDKRLDLEQVLAKYDAKGLPSAGRRIAALHDELESLLDVSLDDLRPTPLAAP